MDIDAMGIRLNKLEKQLAEVLSSGAITVKVDLSPEFQKAIDALNERLAALELAVNAETSAPIDEPPAEQVVADVADVSQETITPPAEQVTTETPPE